MRKPGKEDRLEKQWKWDAKKRRLANVRLGAAIQVVDAVEAKSGRLHHEGLLLLGRRAELCVVVRESDGTVGFVWHRREGTVPAARVAALAKRDPLALPTIEDAIGISEYEFPHGLTHRPLAEVLEEVGLTVRKSKHIGFVKDNTGIGGGMHLLYAVTVGGETSARCPEPGEQIARVKFFPPEKVREIKTVCGLTQAALWRFRAWGLGQPGETLWRRVAERL